MMRDKSHKFYTMWSSRSFGIRAPGTPGCWNDYGGAAFFDRAFSGASCNRKWVFGSDFTAKAPALMGYDPDILMACLAVRGIHQRVWFAKNEELAAQCLRSNQNVLRVPQREWNTCVNVNWVTCAATGHLPSQDSSIIRFATNPGKLSLGFLDGSKWKGGYKMEDIYYFELCVLNELCENGDEMFSCMGSREDEFRCKTNPRRLAAFRDLMLSMDHG